MFYTSIMKVTVNPLKIDNRSGNMSQDEADIHRLKEAEDFEKRTKKEKKEEKEKNKRNILGLND